ncbi:MAG: isochorismatase family protein [Candidatus Marinarcus sp.]|uniref:isochorismatase family protein n=1 Tax=Candidatus Marinarcus sp. TaxID=3100987 RepID=UPI003AFFA8BF
MEIDTKKSALVLIEYQNEWLGQNAKLEHLMKDKKQFEESKVNSKKVLEHARKMGMNIVHIPFIVSSDYKEFGKEKATLGLRAVIQKVKTWQGNSQEYSKDFLPKESEFVISGRVGVSGFAGSNLNTILRNNGIENIFLMGYATNVCVESTLRDAHDKGYNTYVLSDATSAFTKEEKEFFEINIVHHFGAILHTKEFLNLQHKKLAHEIVLEYYNSIGTGNIEKALSLVDEKIEYIAVKDSSNTAPELYGTYLGKEELKKFFKHLNDFYITKEFRVDNSASNEDEAFIKGYLKYEIKRNGAEFDTSWMAFIKIKEGKILKYQFFKDTAHLEEMYAKKG